uniref:Uncharacterized protein n=1 Tax=Monopterus albus TaxID=43700 RepID=A0A3Q3QEY6_MONAL
IVQKILHKVLDAKYIFVLRTVPNMVTWGAVVVLDYAPYINGKFRRDE